MQAGAAALGQFDSAITGVRLPLAVFLGGNMNDGRLKTLLEQTEKDFILEALRQHDWNKYRTAKWLGISRAGLLMKIAKYGAEDIPQPLPEPAPRWRFNK